MGEPRRLSHAEMQALPDAELKTLFQHQFPQATLVNVDGEVTALTVHSVGASERDAMERALNDYHTMREDGLALDQLLNDVRVDLSERGMSRARHDSNQEILNLAENALNSGVITGTVAWIMVPHYTREIEDLRRRVSMRLQMVAQELQLAEQARKRAAQRFPRPAPSEDTKPSLPDRLKGLLWK